MVTVRPFDAARQDRMQDKAGLGMLLASCEHSTQDLLGGQWFFFDTMEQALAHDMNLVSYKAPRPAGWNRGRA